MKNNLILGIILIVAGAAILAYQQFEPIAARGGAFEGGGFCGW